jgi:integrase
MAREAGQALEDDDRVRLLRTLREWSETGSFIALRNRALITLALHSALRLKELLALDVVQLIQDPTQPTIGRLRESAYIRPDQTKGRRKGPRRWTTAGTFVIPEPARIAIRLYLKARIARGWLTMPPEYGVPLFVTIKRRNKANPQPQRLGKRAAQSVFEELHKRAQLAQHYRFHDLRHDCLTRCAELSGGNPFKVAAIGRMTLGTAQRYVHTNPIALRELAELAAGTIRKKRRRSELEIPIEHEADLPL